MNLCQHIDTLAMAYLDDELAEEELRDFELHLRACAACRQHLDAERAALDELRRRLAPGPAPDLLRARLGAALDAEDHAQQRLTRRGRLVDWLLPGAATLVAAAAVALVVVSRGGAPPPADDRLAAVRAHIEAPRIVADATRVANGGSAGVSVEQVDAWTELHRGRRIAVHKLRARDGRGGEATVFARVVDARELELALGRRVVVGGRELFVAEWLSGYAVLHRAAGGLGYVFSSDLPPADLVALIGSARLVERLDRQAPR